jgi:hypothetical protein
VTNLGRQAPINVHQAAQCATTAARQSAKCVSVRFSGARQASGRTATVDCQTGRVQARRSPNGQLQTVGAAVAVAVSRGFCVGEAVAADVCSVNASRHAALAAVCASRRSSRSAKMIWGMRCRHAYFSRRIATLPRSARINRRRGHTPAFIFRHFSLQQARPLAAICGPDWIDPGIQDC